MPSHSSVSLQKDLVVLLSNGRVHILDQNLQLIHPEFRVIEAEEASMLSCAFDSTGKYAAFSNMKGSPSLPLHLVHFASPFILPSPPWSPCKP